MERQEANWFKDDQLDLISLESREALSSPEKEPNPDWVRMFDYPLLFSNQEITPKDRIQLKELLGGKGLSLAEMTQKGLPVPYGFTITTEATRIVEENDGQIPNELWKEILKGLRLVEEKTGKTFGNPSNPLLYSARSGARASQPGMMATILNIGLENAVLEQIERQYGKLCALDSYQRLIRMYGEAVYNISHRVFRDTEKRAKEEIKDLLEIRTRDQNQLEERLGKDDGLKIKYLEALTGLYEMIIQRETGEEFEQDSERQLREAIKAVIQSTMSPSAIAYRNQNGLSHDMPTAVNIQEIILGNVSENSGTAVIFTRDPQTGKKILSGDFLANAQGEQVVAGLKHPRPVNELPANIDEQLQPHLTTLEKMVKGVADIEITWDHEGKLWFLQTRKAKMTAKATVIAAAELFEEGAIFLEEALSSISVDQISSLKKPGFTDAALKEARSANLLLTKGMGINGAGVGEIYLDPERAKSLLEKRKGVILICDHFNPNNVQLVKEAQAIITSLGARSSHMGIVMSEAGCSGIMGCSQIKINQKKGIIIIDEKEYKEGTIVSVSGETGEIFLGELPKTEAPILPYGAQRLVEKWERIYGVNNPWTAFLIPTENQEFLHSFRLKKCQEVFIQAQKDWPGLDKAQQIVFLEQILPREIKIPETIVRISKAGLTPKTIEEIREKTLTAKRQGCSVYLRSDNGKLLSPYVSTDFGIGDQNEEALQNWLTQPNSPHSKWSGLSKWVDKENVQAVIVGSDPADKLSSEVRKQHFVCTLSCSSTSPPEIVVEINDQNIHLRSLGKTTAEQLIQIVAKASPKALKGFGQVNYKFGTDHFDGRKFQILVDQLNSLRTHPQVQALKRKMIREFGDDCLKELAENNLQKMLQALEEKNLLNPADYNLFIKDRSLAITNFVKQNIFKDWWDKYALPHLMWAIKETTEASVLEFQGRLDPEGKSKPWMLVYGTKGKEEAEKIRKTT